MDIADQCTFSLDELRYEYPEELAPRGFVADAISAATHLARGKSCDIPMVCQIGFGNFWNTN